MSRDRGIIVLKGVTMEKTIYVYENRSGDKPVVLGRLYHLRNHGFILTNTSWKLSPLYDANPVPYRDTLSLNVSEDDNSSDIELART